MIAAIIELVIRFRWIVWGLIGVLVALSIYSASSAAIRRE